MPHPEPSRAQEKLKFSHANYLLEGKNSFDCSSGDTMEANQRIIEVGKEL